MPLAKEEFCVDQHVRCTDTVVNNLGGRFPAGTVFLVEALDAETERAGPMLANVAEDDQWFNTGIWFYWESADGVEGCDGKFELVAENA